MVKFGSENVKSSGRFGFIYLLLFVVVLVIFIRAVSVFGTSNTEKQKESLENALNKTIVECYALEGAYPPSLEYLKEHYGLLYNEDLFFVDYDYIGSNLRPDTTVIVRRND
ncbi:MAG: hypothetical protein K6G40_00665 [Eubacterium sp.]|nr:hypothetical protein [Eubacterium sp.]